MKITEAQRARFALLAIEEYAAYGECETMGNPKAQKIFGQIYKAAHTVNSPSCRENHKSWLTELDDAIHSARRQKPKRGKK